MDSLIEAITELVIRELEAAKPEASMALTSKGTSESSSVASSATGPKLLVMAGPETICEPAWTALAGAKVRPTVFGSKGIRVPEPASKWLGDSPSGGWSGIVGDYAAVCLLGADLATLGSIAGLGAGEQPQAAAAVAAVAAGLPVFCESTVYEKIRRHSSRLAPGFVRVFEDSWRVATSFGIEFGAVPELGTFLTRVGGKQHAIAQAASKGGGRDVVTTEDVEAAKRAGHKQLMVGMGAIITPLARQQALEWGIEVKSQ